MELVGLTGQRGSKAIASYTLNSGTQHRWRWVKRLHNASTVSQGDGSPDTH
jgi:hypothetical protein